MKSWTPSSLTEFGSGLPVAMATDWMRTRVKPFLLLQGPPGCGKTTLARLLLGEEMVDLNASDDRNKDAIRAAYDASLSGLPVLLDEADHLGTREQKQLLKFEPRGPFILCANEVSEIEWALRERCLDVFVPPPSRERLREIAKKVGAGPKTVVMAKSYRDLVNEGLVVGQSAGEVTAAILGGDREAGSVTDVMRCDVAILDNSNGLEPLEFDRWRTRYRQVGKVMEKHLRRAAACGIQEPKFPWSLAWKGKLKREKEARVEETPRGWTEKKEKVEPKVSPVMGAADEWT